MIRLRYGAATDPGVVRSVNEDSFVAQDGLYAVADGMGGHVSGEVASEVAVEALQAGDYEGLIEGVRLANRAVWQRARDDASLRGMGTTMCAIALIEDAEGNEVLQVANVGDSRAYRFRQGELEQLTEDHSLVEELVREGRITPEEAKVHPQRNIVTRVLGVEPDVNVDCKIVDPYAGDRYLICSDGLFNEVPESEIARVLRHERDPEAASNDLVRMAREAGGRDNITVVLVDVTDDGGKAESASAVLAADPGATTARRIDHGAEDDGVRPRSDTTMLHAVVPGAAAADDAPAKHRRFTWRVALFTLVLLAIIAGAAYATWWFGRNTYYVGEQGDEVTIFRGRPGGVLWMDPTVEQETGLPLADVPRANQDDIEEGRQFATLGKAEAYVANLLERRQAERGEDTTTTTTTTAPPATTVPPPAPTTTAAPTQP